MYDGDANQVNVGHRIGRGLPKNVYLSADGRWGFKCYVLYIIDPVVLGDFDHSRHLKSKHWKYFYPNIFSNLT